jgi:hypothetical protein
MAEERPQSVEEWRAMLAGDIDANPPPPPRPITSDSGTPRPAASAPAAQAPARRSWLRMAAYAAGVVAIGVAAIGLYELVRSWSG